MRLLQKIAFAEMRAIGVNDDRMASRAAMTDWRRVGSGRFAYPDNPGQHAPLKQG